MSNEFRDLIKKILDERADLSPCIDIDCEITRHMLAKELDDKIKSNFNLKKIDKSQKNKIFAKTEYQNSFLRNPDVNRARHSRDTDKTSKLRLQ